MYYTITPVLDFQQDKTRRLQHAVDKIRFDRDWMSTSSMSPSPRASPVASGTKEKKPLVSEPSVSISYINPRRDVIDISASLLGLL